MVRHLTLSKDAKYVAIETAERVIVGEVETGKEHLRFPFRDAAIVLFLNADTLSVSDKNLKVVQDWSMKTKAQILPPRPRA